MEKMEGVMMEIKDQVCSLELSKRLKELGCKQESLWYWFQFRDYEPRLKFHSDIDGTGGEWNTPHYSAFTVAELGIALADWQIVTRKINKTEWSCYCVAKFAHTPEDQFANTEVNARAKMLIYLLEKKLMEITR